MSNGRHFMGTKMGTLVGTRASDPFRQAIGYATLFFCMPGLVELRGFEPLTSAVRLQRSPI